MGLKWGCLVAAMAVISVAAPRTARADEGMLTILSLEINRVAHGDVHVILRGRDVLLRRSDLDRLNLLLPALVNETFKGEEYVALSTLAGLTYLIDEKEAMLRVQVPAKYFPETVHNLRVPPKDIDYRKDTSAYLNYAPRFSYGPRSRTEDVRRLDVYSEAAFSSDGRSYFTSAYLSSEYAPVRGLTNVIMDERAKLQRFTFGDNFAATGALGGATFFAGVTIATAFQLDPYFVALPPLGFTGSVATPATVDVFVNGQRVRRTEVGPGPFRLENAPFVPGGGVTTYVIRDVFGREQQVGIPFYISPGALAPGLGEYTYAGGVQRFGVGVESWDYRSGLMMARHRVGLTRQVTVGARWEATTELVSGGPSITAVVPIGQFDLEAAVSNEGASAGAAGLAGYSYIARGFAGGVSARLATDHYATVSLRGVDDRSLFDATAFTSVPLWQRSSFTMQYAVAKRRDFGITGRIGAVYNVQLSRTFNLFVTASRYHTEGSGSPFEVFATLSVFFGGGHTASVGMGRRGESEQLSLNANKPLPLGEGYGYRATANFAEHRQLNAGAQYQTLFGRYGATYSSFDDVHDVYLDAAGSIVWVRDGGVHFSLPVRDAFGLIHVPGVRNVRGYLNNQEVGRTDKQGRLLVPSMLSYYGNRLSIADADVPIGYNIQTTELVVAPTFRGAGVGRFPMKEAHYYRGSIVVVKGGVRTVPRYGELTLQGPAGSAALAPLSIGKEGQFELVDLEPGSYAAHIEYKEGVCDLALAIPRMEGAIIDLGAVECEGR